MALRTAARRGAHWILNLPPNTTGVIPEAYVRSAAQTGDAIRRSFGASVGSAGAGLAGQCDELATVVTATAGFDAVMIREDLASGGQVVLGYSLELRECATGRWARVALDSTLAGQTVGMKSIATLQTPSAACAVRFNCTRAIGGAKAMVRLLGVSLHKIQAPQD